MAKIHVAQALKPRIGDTTNRVSAIPVNLELENSPEATNHVGKARTALEDAIKLNKNLRNGYLLLAQLLVAAHQSEDALKGLLSFASGTNDVAALMQIGMIHEQLNNPHAARDAYEKALGLEPQFGLALNNLAYLYSEKLKQPDKGYEMAAKARDLMPSDPYTADTLGWILYRRKQYSRALGLIEEGAMRLTDDPEIQYHLGMTFYMMGDEESARRALERASRSAQEAQLRKNADQALSVLAIKVDTAGAAETTRLQQALTNNAADPVALMRLAEIQSHKGDYRNALANYESALSAHPQNGRLLFKIAELYSEHLNDRPKAIELAKKAHDLSPEDAAVSKLLGRLLSQQGDYRDYNWAVTLLEEADRKLPGDPAALYDLAVAYYNLGRVAGAEKTMRKVTAGAPNGPRHADAELFLSMLALLGDPASLHSSSAKVQAVLRQQPDYIPASMVSARLFEDQLDFQGAARVYSDILRRNPLFASATRNLALLYFEHLNNEAKAYELAVKAHESFLEDVALTRALGILCYKRAEYRQTVLLLGRGPAEASADSEQLYYLGMAYYQLKENAPSKAALRKALDLNLKPQLASEANRALNTMN
jgi:tetratricopeptide (TPR) repeat protein